MSPFDRVPEGMWKPHDARAELPIAALDNSHLLNCIAFLERGGWAGTDKHAQLVTERALRRLKAR